MDYIDTKLQFIPQMIDMIVFVWHVPKRQLRENLKRGIKIDYICNLVLATIITINTVFLCVQPNLIRQWSLPATLFIHSAEQTHSLVQNEVGNKRRLLWNSQNDLWWIRKWVVSSNTGFKPRVLFSVGIMMAESVRTTSGTSHNKR